MNRYETRTTVLQHVLSIFLLSFLCSASTCLSCTSPFPHFTSRLWLSLTLFFLFLILFSVTPSIDLSLLSSQMDLFMRHFPCLGSLPPLIVPLSPIVTLIDYFSSFSYCFLVSPLLFHLYFSNASIYRCLRHYHRSLKYFPFLTFLFLFIYFHLSPRFFFTYRYIYCIFSFPPYSLLAILPFHTHSLEPLSL